MQKMDNGAGKLVLVFTHISQQYLNLCASGSGREVIGLPLETLPIDVWKTDSRFEQWKNASTNPAVHQLLLQCCGHPRSLFDGLAAALQKEERLLTSSDELAFENARTAIKQKCKFNSFADEELEEAIVKWLSIFPQTAGFKDQLWRDGLLLKPADDRTTDYFPPLLLQDLAGRRAKDGSSLAFHLKQVYRCDALLGFGTEKKMEGLLYHYEAVLRKAVEGQTFTLKQFYQSKQFGKRFLNLRAKAPVPEQTDLVERVPDFQDEERVLGKLNSGFIVVSDCQNEVGVEYLAPFRTAEAGKLIVACVQCKFVKTSTNWTSIQTQMSTATDWLKKQKIQHFPVIYTTADLSSLQPQTYEDGIYFTEEDIFEFTKKLGVLRLHTQKLGKKMQKKHPYLQRASSNADMWYVPLFHQSKLQTHRPKCKLEKKGHYWEDKAQAWRDTLSQSFGNLISRDEQDQHEACSILYNYIDMTYMIYDMYYVCDIYIYDVGYEEKERRDAQTKEEAKHSPNLLEAQADTMMLQGRKKNQMKKERRT